MKSFLSFLFLIMAGLSAATASAATASAATASAAAASSCPFCDAPSLLMAEQVHQCDHLLLGKWLGGDKPSEIKAGTSRFEVVKVAKSSGDRFTAG